MPIDAGAMCRSFLPNNPRLAEIILMVCKDTYKARFLPKTLVRLLVNRAVDEIRRAGHEFTRDPEFVVKMTTHARSLYGRFRGEIGLLNSSGTRPLR
ncbi:MAG: hypothetical protein HEQ32_00970 [Vampirovibrio sp.]|jgi:hypothetical protein